MRRLVFCALVMFTGTCLADQLSSARLSVEPPCLGGFQAIAGRVETPMPAVSSGILSAFRNEFPQIQDPENFAALYRQRLAAWRGANPTERLPNVPMLENKPAVDWLRATLINLRKDPYYRYPDDETRKLTQGPRIAQTAKFLAAIRQIERTGYKARDVAELASDVFEFLGKIDQPPPFVGELLEHLKDKFRLDIRIPAEKIRRLLDMKVAAFSERAVGQRAIWLNQRYERAVVEAIREHWPSGAHQLDIADVVRRYKYRFGFAIRPEDRLMNEGLLRVLNGDNPIIFATRETSVRTLAEATLFKIDIAGFISEPMRADGGVMGPAKFLRHDFIHIEGTRSDPISSQIVDWDTEKKRKLLAKIDAISDSRKKAISEFALLTALRESPGSQGTLFSQAFSEENWIKVMQEKFKLLGDTALSDDEARWVIRWWKENLPVN